MLSFCVVTSPTATQVEAVEQETRLRTDLHIRVGTDPIDFQVLATQRFDEHVRGRAGDRRSDWRCISLAEGHDRPKRMLFDAASALELMFQGDH